VIVHDSQELVEDPGEVCLVAPVERGRHGHLVRFRAGGHDRDAGELRLPRRDRVAQRARDPGGISAGLEEHSAAVARAGALLQADVGASPVSDAVGGVSPTRQRREVPARRGARGDATDPVHELGVASIAERVAVDEGLELPREPRLSGDPPERLRGHSRRPRAGREERRRRGVAVHEPLRLVHDVGGNVDRTASLHAHVEEPPGASEGGAIHELFQLVHALLFDGRPVLAEGAEERWSTDEPLDQSGHRVVAPRHDLRSQRPAFEARPHVLEVGLLHEPRLVSEHVEARFVQPSYGARLAPVLAREDHHVSTALVDEPPERVVGRGHDGAPARGMRGAPVETLDEGEEIAQLGALARVHEHLVGRARLWHAQGQGGVEVPRIEKEQRVHRAQRWYRTCVSATVWQCFPGRLGEKREECHGLLAPEIRARGVVVGRAGRARR